MNNSVLGLETLLRFSAFVFIQWQSHSATENINAPTPTTSTNLPFP